MLLGLSGRLCGWRPQCRATPLSEGEGCQASGCHFPTHTRLRFPALDVGLPCASCRRGALDEPSTVRTPVTQSVEEAEKGKAVPDSLRALA